MEYTLKKIKAGYYLIILSGAESGFGITKSGNNWVVTDIDDDALETASTKTEAFRKWLQWR